MGMLDKLFGTPQTQPACNLWIGSDPAHLRPVDDPEGLGGYQLAIDQMLREEAPAVIHLRSDNPKDLSVVRKALEYLSRIGAEVAVAEQLPIDEVAALFGVSLEDYRAAIKDPDGPLVALGERS